MGLRYQRRVNLGQGVGLNVSGSGVSPSLRTKYGSIGPRGFSIRTGIPGLSFRSSGGSRRKKDAGGELIAILLLGLLILTALLIWNMALFLGWAFRECVNSYKRYQLRKKEDTGASIPDAAENRTDFIFEATSIPEKFRTVPIIVSKILRENQTTVRAGEDVAEIDVDGNKGMIAATCSGTIVYFKSQGDRLRFGDRFFTVEHFDQIPV